MTLLKNKPLEKVSFTRYPRHQPLFSFSLICAIRRSQEPSSVRQVVTLIAFACLTQKSGTEEYLIVRCMLYCIPMLPFTLGKLWFTFLSRTMKPSYLLFFLLKYMIHDLRACGKSEETSSAPLYSTGCV